MPKVGQLAIRLLVCTWVLIVGQPGGAAEEPAKRPVRPRLDYVVERLEAPGSGLKITLTAAGASEGRTTFAIYETWGGAPDVAREVHGLTVLGADRRELSVEQVAPHRWSVDHTPGERLELAYRLLPAPTDREGRHRYLPVISDDLVLLVGHTALIYPDRFSDDRELDVRIRFDGFDAPGWRVVTSFGSSDGTLRLQRPLGELLHAFYVAGKLRYYTREIQGATLNLALAGESWRFDDESFSDMVTRIMKFQREFHRDLDQPPYTVCLVPYPYKQPDSSSSGGSCLTDSFILYLTPQGYAREGGTGLEPLETLITHEYFHNWNTPGPDDDAMHWFSEGFTVFYERRVLLRLGLYDLDDYVAHLNRTIRDYMTSPVKTRPNADYVDSRMLDHALESLPYRRGAVIALLVDEEIRRASDGARSLDDLMRERAAAARTSGRLADGEAALALIEKYSSAAFARSIRAVALDGAPAVIPADTYQACLEMHVAEMAPFELGFDFRASREARSVSGVAQGSSAWAAGLRDGQKLVGWSVRHGDAETAVELKIVVEEERKTIRFLPQGAAVAVPQFSLREEREADCRSLL